MRTAIRKIGNSKSIIFPKSILTQCKIENEVSIVVAGHRVIITGVPAQKGKGWEKAFKEMAKNGDDALAIPDVFNDENIGGRV